jgi:hypothetical protein
VIATLHRIIKILIQTFSSHHQDPDTNLSKIKRQEVGAIAAGVKK